MTRTEIETAIAQAVRAWIAGDGDGFASLFITNGEFIVPGDRWVGRDKIRQAVIDYASAYSNLKIEIRRIVVDGNFAVVEWYWEDTENATGKPNKADDAIAIDFQDGLISRWREYIDWQN
jgi:uncharacterized protein (TIGR02246 family)